MKNILSIIGVIGSVFILGAAGMADTLNSEHMFKPLLIGLFLVVVAVISSYYLKIFNNSKVVNNKIKKLRASL